MSELLVMRTLSNFFVFLIIGDDLEGKICQVSANSSPEIGNGAAYRIFFYMKCSSS
jgi:hypothetical protein